MKHARKDYDRIQDPARLIPDDEPVFLIRGQDMCAPSVLNFWADQAETAGADAEIVRRARLHAIQMRIWQKQKGSKAPDMPNTA